MEKNIKDIDLSSLLPDYASPEDKTPVKDTEILENNSLIKNKNEDKTEKAPENEETAKDEEYTSFNFNTNSCEEDESIQEVKKREEIRENIGGFEKNKQLFYKNTTDNPLFSEKELELVNDFNDKFNKIEGNYNKYKYIIEKRSSVEEDLRNIRKVYSQLETDKKNVRLALVSLKSWYGNYKQDIINSLQININKMLNGFFGSKHRIMLKQDVQRGKSVVNMMEVNEKGDNLGDIGVMLSGAERQMTGFLIQSSILSTLNSNFIILDEAFSSFGKDEVKMIPKLLENLDDIQMIVIEHKEEMFEEFPVRTIRIDNNDELGTHIIDVE